jgi:hypothetical protein
MMILTKMKSGFRGILTIEIKAYSKISALNKKIDLIIFKRFTK